MATLLLTPPIFLAALLTIRAEGRGTRRVVYCCKPLATALLVALALARGATDPRPYAAAIVVGLLCSLAGDIFLMLPQDRFIAGLISFLLAHLAYIVAFGLRAQSAPSWPSLALLLPLLLYGALIWRRLRPGLGGLALPVFLYLLVILAMAWRALDLALAERTGSALAAALGALLFVGSDTLLAWNRFVARLRGAQALILGTYFAAQWLIALSI